jgi:heme exporter protein A
MVTEAAPAAATPVAGLARPDAVVVEGLVRRFGEREALAGIDVALAPGETLAVLGPNGAGKTTFLRVLATLLRPHAGSVAVLGHELPREADAVRSRIGFVAHEPLLYRDLTGRENLAFYARLYGIAARADRIEALLEATGMTKRADDPLRSLSRGMVQRLAVCRAVLHAPALLLLDEPRAGLDPDAAELVEPLIGRACGCTRVLVTHDVDRSLSESERILGLVGGRVTIAAAARELTAVDFNVLYRGR